VIGAPSYLWSILVPTIGEREALFLRLMGVLLPQLDQQGGAVRVLAWKNNGYPPLGVIRDALVRDADSEYVSFIDDDDLVPEDYVAEIVNAFTSRPAHVGFKIEYTTNGEGREVVDHSLRHGKWGRDASGQLVRDFTHIDPVRQDIAALGTFIVPRKRAEDRAWVRQVRPALIGQPEVYIDKIMYHYLWREDTTAWRRQERLIPREGRPQVDSPHFAWHGSSS